jgi:hypothetical protein
MFLLAIMSPWTKLNLRFHRGLLSAQIKFLYRKTLIGHLSHNSVTRNYWKPFYLIIILNNIHII